MPRYEPGQLPRPEELDNQRLAEFLQEETRRLSGVIAELDQGRRSVLYAEPTRPRTGQLAYADGTTWDPGDGDGLYYYDGTEWVFCGAARLGKNALINGDFRVAQRGTSFTSTGGANNDDVYHLDRWLVLSDGNDIVDITQDGTNIPTNGQYSIDLDVETVNKKFGIAQIIEWRNCKGLIGNTVTLSFKAQVSSTTNLDNVKAAIIAWSGTADTVTSDIISAWGAENTNPTLITNATYENTPANLGVTTSWAEYSVSAAIDTANTKNIIVFIWSDVTTTSLTERLRITDVQLEVGDRPTGFEYRQYEDELAHCQRYFEVDAGINLIHGDVTAGSGYFDVGAFRVTKRVAPVIVYIYVATSGAFAAAAPLASTVTTQQWRCYAVATGTAAGAYLGYTWVCDAEL